MIHFVLEGFALLMFEHVEGVVALQRGRLGAGADPALATAVIAGLLDPDDGSAEAWSPVVRVAGAARGPTQSVKGQNVVLDLGKLLRAVGTVALASVAAAAAPWTVPLVAILAIGEAIGLSSVEIEEREATVLWSLWLHGAQAHPMTEAELLDAVNTELLNNGRPTISGGDLAASLQKLRAISCITEEASAEHRWRLLEKIKIA